MHKKEMGIVVGVLLLLDNIIGNIAQYYRYVHQNILPLFNNFSMIPSYSQIVMI